LTGELSQKTPQGVRHVDAGQVMPGHEPGMPMQVSSSGTSEALVMFVADATKPFSSPTTMAACRPVSSEWRAIVWTSTRGMATPPRPSSRRRGFCFGGATVQVRRLVDRIIHT